MQRWKEVEKLWVTCPHCQLQVEISEKHPLFLEKKVEHILAQQLELHPEVMEEDDE